jgi:hypothetical protein
MMGRGVSALLLGSVIVVGACGQTAPPSPVATSGQGFASPSATSRHPSSSAAATGSLAPLPMPAIRATLPLGHVIDLAAAKDGAWFLAVSGGAGTVGLLAPSGVVRKAVSGPIPTAIAATDDAVFIVEGVPDGGSAAPRTGVLERLDPVTLRVSAHVPLADPTTDVIAAGGAVWTIDTTGRISEYNATSLASTWTSTVAASGAGTLAASSDAVWAANGVVADSGEGTYVVTRIELAGHAMKTLTLPGDGVHPMIAAGKRAWLAAAVYPVFDWLYPLDDGIAAGTPEHLPAPVAMATGMGRLWWVSGDGSAGAIDEASGARTPSWTLPGDSGTSVAIAGGDVYLAGGDAVVLVTLAAP